jgi:hypothetical protein
MELLKFIIQSVFGDMDIDIRGPSIVKNSTEYYGFVGNSLVIET